MMKKASGSIGTQPYRTELEIRGHQFISDEPTDAHGQDLGPTPTELLCAALVACKTITMRMYADRKGWPMESAHVEVTHERVKAEDLDLDDDRKGLISLFRTEIHLEGELSEKEQTRLKEIAARCPVHRSLASSSVIR